MAWLIRGKEEVGGAAETFTRSEIIKQLYSDEICLSDFVRKTGTGELWLPIYSVPEITAPVKSFMQGMRLFYGHKPGRAINAFNNAATDPHFFSFSCLFLGLIHSYQDGFDRAAYFYDKCRDLKGFSSLIRNNLGVCYAYTGRPDDALRELSTIPARKLSRFWMFRAISLWLDRFYPMRMFETKLEKIALVNIRLINEMPPPFRFGSKARKDESSRDVVESSENSLSVQRNTYKGSRFKLREINNYIEEHSFFDFMHIDKVTSMISGIYDYAMVLDPGLYSELRSFYPRKIQNEEMAVQSARYNHGKDLFEKGQIYAAKQIFCEMEGYRELSEEAAFMIKECDKEEEKMLVQQYRAFKTKQRYNEALKVLGVLKSRFATSNLLSLSAEEDFIRGYLAADDLKVATAWLDKEIPRLKKRYTQSLAREEIDIERTASIKEDCENFLLKTERFIVSKSDHLENIRKDAKGLIDRCRNDIRTSIENRLGESLTSNSSLGDCARRIVEVSIKHRRFLEDVGIKTDRYFHKLYERCDNSIAELRRKAEQGTLLFDELTHFVRDLNDLTGILPANNRLKDILDEAVGMIFRYFLKELDDISTNEILLSLNPEKRESYNGIYLLNKSLRRLESLQQVYQRDNNVDNLRDILDSINNFPHDEATTRLVVNRLRSLSRMFANSRDFANELIVIDTLKSTFGVADEEIRRRIHICKQAGAIKEFAPFKRELKEIYELYRQNANSALEGRLTTDELASLINGFSSKDAKFGEYGDLLEDAPGTSVKEWRTKTKSYLGIIRSEYDRRLLAAIKGTVKDTINPDLKQTIEYMRIHPVDYLEREEIREIFYALLNKHPNDRKDSESSFLTQSGIEGRNIFDKLSHIASSDDSILSERILQELERRETPDVLDPMLFHYREKNRQKSFRKQFAERVKVAMACTGEDLGGILDPLIQFSDSPESSVHIDASMELQLSGLRRKWHGYAVGTLRHFLVDGDCKRAGAFLKALPSSLREEMKKSADFADDIHPELVLYDAGALIEGFNGRIYSMGDEQISNSIKQLNSIILMRPKESGILKDRLWEEINGDTMISEDRKAKYRLLLDG